MLFNVTKPTGPMAAIDAVSGSCVDIALRRFAVIP
jgi:hypothetical protein